MTPSEKKTSSTRPASPFVAGIVAGIVAPVETPDREMGHFAPNVTIRELASRYAVSARTVHRWKNAGVNVRDPNAVALYLIKNPRSSFKAIIAVQAIIEK